MSPAKPLILILEDNVAAADALRLILSDWGAEVVHAVDRDSAVAALGARAGQVRFIITDFNLGAGQDGVSLARTLADLTPQARVLVLSGSFHGRAAAAAATVGYDEMQKPARADLIVAWLERD